MTRRGRLTCRRALVLALGTTAAAACRAPGAEGTARKANAALRGRDCPRLEALGSGTSREPLRSHLLATARWCKDVLLLLPYERDHLPSAARWVAIAQDYLEYARRLSGDSAAAIPLPRWLATSRQRAWRDIERSTCCSNEIVHEIGWRACRGERSPLADLVRAPSTGEPVRYASFHRIEWLAGEWDQMGLSDLRTPRFREPFYALCDTVISRTWRQCSYRLPRPIKIAHETHRMRLLDVRTGALVAETTLADERPCQLGVVWMRGDTVQMTYPPAAAAERWLRGHLALSTAP